VTTEQLDAAKAEAFAGHVVGILNGGLLSLMFGIGHHTGLYDTMAEMPPATSAQIAKRAGLNERYVREWLGAMVTGGIVDYDPSNSTYHLPAEHAASLTRAAGPGNLCTIADFLPEMAAVRDAVAECFRTGGGVPYSEYENFQQLMSAMSSDVHDATLIDATLPLVPGLIQRLEAGIDVADLGCGSGHAINLMAQRFPKSRFTGYDFSEEGVATGRAEAKEMGLSNASFEVQDLANMSGSEQFDVITVFDAIHDQAQPRQVLKNIHNLLRPGGVFFCVDIQGSSHLHENMEHPLAPALYSISTLHCMTVSLALDGEGLGTMWGEQVARELMADAGFTSTDVKQVEGDIFNNYYIATKS